MYLEFYGLKEMPFGLTPDPRYIFKTESQGQLRNIKLHANSRNTLIANT